MILRDSCNFKMLHINTGTWLWHNICAWQFRTYSSNYDLLFGRGSSCSSNVSEIAHNSHQYNLFWKVSTISMFQFLENRPEVTIDYNLVHVVLKGSRTVLIEIWSSVHDTYIHVLNFKFVMTAWMQLCPEKHDLERGNDTSYLWYFNADANCLDVAYIGW